MTSSDIVNAAQSRFSMKLLKKWIISKLIPLDYTRCIEIPLLLEASSILNENRPLKILDIGSPQILSTALALKSDKWEITYINSFQNELDDLEFKCKLLNIKNIKTLKHDVTEPIDFNCKFDYIFSCSVFEHIAPEEDGDVVASRHISNYMNDNAVFALSVPFYKYSFNEYVYTNVYARQNDDGSKMFFQRFYDENSLLIRILKPSMLTLNKTYFIGERFFFPKNPHKRLGILFSSSLIGMMFGPLFKVFSSIFMVVKTDWKLLIKPYIAVIVLNNKRAD